MGANETNNRIKDQLKETQHKIHLHQIENEALIKQIDLADAKTREKEDDLRLQAQEYDSKLKLQLERLMVRRAKNEERETFELKRKHRLDLDELQAKHDETAEEVDYYKQKCDKLEVEQASLRSGKGENKRLKELENEVEMLKLELEEARKVGGGGSGADKAGARAELRSFRKDLSPEEQIQMQRELAQLDKILGGYQEENAKSVKVQRELEQKLKQLTAQSDADKRDLKEM